MKIVRPLVLLLVKHNINLKLKHIPGKKQLTGRSHFSFPGHRMSTQGTRDELGTNRHPRLHKARKLRSQLREDVYLSLAANTKKAYNASWTKYVHFMYNTLERDPCPTSSKNIALYVTHLHASGLKASSIRSHLSAIHFITKSKVTLTQLTLSLSRSCCRATVNQTLPRKLGNLLPGNY